MKLAAVVVSLSLGVSLSFYLVTFQNYIEVPSDQGNIRAAVVQKGKKNKKCAPQKGLIVSNMVGLLGNDLFEAGMANRLAKELCWDVIYRPYWNPTMPSRQSQKCFPNAMQPESVSAELKEELGITDSLWQDLTLRMEEEEDWDDDSNKRVYKWYKNLKNEGLAWRCKHEHCDFSGNRTDELVESIREGNSPLRVIYLQAFFIHYDWLRQWREPLREWMTPDPSCCYSTPPEDAVVIHVRDFEPEDDGKNKGLRSGVYLDILEHYELMDRPVWIVCQPKSVKIPLIRALVRKIPNAIVHTGQDAYDAFCILQRAKTLVISTSSSYSQMASLLGSPDMDVHYPTHTLDNPMVTLSVPEWKYHLIGETMDRIEEIDVEDHDRLSVELS